MKRGDIVLTVGRGDFSTKPRPSLIVQADAFNSDHPIFTVCPITTYVTGAFFYRVQIAREPGNGLREDSEVEIDLIQAMRQERTRDVIGSASPDVMIAVDQALRRWLSL